MRVQKMCRRLVLLLLAAACLCQMALAVNSNFRYGSKNVSWVEMEGSDVLLIDGDAAERSHPTANAGDWLKVAPAARRRFSAAADTGLTYFCIQTGENSLGGFTAEDVIWC